MSLRDISIKNTALYWWDKLCLELAAKVLPKRLVYWCFIMVGAEDDNHHETVVDASDKFARKYKLYLNHRL